MPIPAASLVWRYSNPAATSGNSADQQDPNAALGGFLATTTWSGGSTDDLFATVTPEQNTERTPTYRCLFLYNADATRTAQEVALYLTGQDDAGATLWIGVDARAATAAGSSTAQATQISSETTAPAGVTFVLPGSAATGLALGDLGPGQCRAVWLKRVPADTAPVVSDSAVLHARYQSYD